MLDCRAMNYFPQQNKSPRSTVGTFLAMMGFAVSSCGLPPLITTIAEDLAISYTSFGTVIMLQFFSFFITGIIGGWLGEHYRVSSRSFVLAGLFIVALVMLIGSQINSLSGFALWAIPLGAGGGLVEIFCSVIISQKEKPHSSKLMNLSQVFFCLGAILAPVIAAILLKREVSWRSIFVFYSLFLLFILCVFFLLTREGSPVAAYGDSKGNNHSSSLLKDPLFIFLSGSLFVYVTFESVVACWVSVYFEKGLSCSVQTSALQLSLYWTGLIVGRFGIVLVPNRFTLWPVMFTGIIVWCAGAFLAMLTGNPFWAGVFVFLTGLGAGPLWPTIVAICQSARNRAKFTSAVIAVGALGVVAGSGLGSAIFKYFGSSFFFPTVVMGGLILFVLSIFSYQKYSQADHK